MSNEKPNRRAASAVSVAAIVVLVGAGTALFVLESCGPAPATPTTPGTPTSTDTSIPTGTPTTPTTPTNTPPPPT